MSAQPTERPLLTDFDRRASNELAVSAMLDYLVLPAATMTPRADAVHITVVRAADLATWMYHLGGQVQQAPGADGVALWTLHTRTPERRDGSTVAIRVHCAVVEGEDVLTDVRQGVGE
ncbi:hypothetical protein AB0H29_08195 [Streptomyces thermolilacinus]